MRQLFFFLGLGISGVAMAQSPKLYITLISHNEDNIGYDQSSTLYYNNRTALVNICQLLQSKGVSYNYGADYVALQAVAALDTGMILNTTNGKNLVRWMKEDMNIACDPHSHETTYNYADVHYLMTQLGVIPSDVMSGFLYNTPQNGIPWDAYENGVYGKFFSAHFWQPKILWGGATPMHVSDPHFFGVFKPKSMAEYFVHDPGKTLTSIGVGCAIKLENTTSAREVDSIIKHILAGIQNQSLPSNGFYTQEIFFSEGKVNQPWFLPLLNEVIDSVNAKVATGSVAWKNLTEIYDLWQTDFAASPFAHNCDGADLLGIDDPDFQQHFLVKISPNPCQDEIQIVFEPSTAPLSMCILNALGQCVWQMNVINTQQLMISTAHLPNGIYYLQGTMENRSPIQERIMILH